MAPSRTFPGPGTWPLSGLGRGFKFLSGINGSGTLYLTAMKGSEMKIPR